MEGVFKFLKDEHNKDECAAFLKRPRIAVKKELEKRSPFPASAGGYVCTCTGNCDSSRCSCYKNGAKCTSKCHNGRGSARKCKCVNMATEV